MKLRSALSASALGILIATASAVPAHAEHDRGLLDRSSINSVTVSESSGVAKDEPTEATTPAAPTESPIPEEPTKPSESPSPTVPQDPTDPPKKSPVPKDPSTPPAPTAPAKPTVPREPTGPPTPTRSSKPPALETPAKLWETTLPAVPAEPHTPVAPMIPTVPEAPATLPSTTEDEELVEPPTVTADPEISEMLERSFGIVTDVFGQPGAVDARLGLLEGDATPQLRGELVAESAPWEHPEGVTPAVSFLEITEQSRSHTSAVSMASLLGGLLLLTAGAMLLFRGLRANHRREDSLDIVSPDN